MDPTRYRLRLHLYDLCFGALEAAAVVAPLWGFFDPGRVPQGMVPLLSGAGVLAALLWAVLLHRERAPLDRALRRLQEGRGARRDELAAARRVALSLGWRSLWLRVALCFGYCALVGVLGTVRLGLPAESILVLFWSAALYTPSFPML